MRGRAAVISIPVGSHARPGIINSRQPFLVVDFYCAVRHLPGAPGSQEARCTLIERAHAHTRARLGSQPGAPRGAPVRLFFADFPNAKLPPSHGVRADAKTGVISIPVLFELAPIQARPFWVEAGVGEAAVQSRYYSLYVDRSAPVQSVGGASYRETTSPFGFRLGAGAKLWDNGAGVRLDVVGRYQWLDAAALRVGSAGPAGFADVGLSLAFGRPRAREN